MNRIEHGTDVNSKGAGTPDRERTARPSREICKSSDLDLAEPHEVSERPKGASAIEPDHEVSGLDLAAGDDLCITSPSKRQNTLETGGEDTSEVSYYLRWDVEEYEKIMDKLKSAQHAARQDGDGLKGDIVRIGDRDYLVKPAGAKGKGNGSPYYAYVLESRGLRIKLAQRPEPHERIPNASVHAGSLLLMQAGFGNVLQDTRDALTNLGCVVERSKLTRIDACVDLAGVDVGEFTKALNKGCVITRARKRAIHFNGDRPTGMTCGSGAVMMRAYDKALEVKQKQDEAKRLHLEKNRWGGKPKTATRVEFQLRREALKSLGIDTPEDWLNKRAAIVAYLCGEWCRIVMDVDKDNSNYDRAVLLDEWEAVREAFAAWAGRSEPAERKKDPKPDARALVKQAAGCLTSAYAVSREHIARNVDEFFADVVDRVWREITDDGADAPRLMDKLARRRKVLECQGRAAPTGKPPHIKSDTY